jgi:hypothetical protein
MSSRQGTRGGGDRGGRRLTADHIFFFKMSEKKICKHFPSQVQ